MDPAILQPRPGEVSPASLVSVFQHLHCRQVGVQHSCLPRYVGSPPHTLPPSSSLTAFWGRKFWGRGLQFPA